MAQTPETPTSAERSGAHREGGAPAGTAADTPAADTPAGAPAEASASFVTAEHEIDYRPAALDCFAELADQHYSLLLESADAGAEAPRQSIAVLRSAVRVTFAEGVVRVAPLTETGRAMVARLSDELSALSMRERSDGGMVFDFSVGASGEPADVLRALVDAAGYRSESDLLPFVGGGFAFDYAAQFYPLPDVAEGPNTFPDYDFYVAETLLQFNHRDKTAFVAGVRVGTAGAEEELEKELRSLAGEVQAGNDKNAEDDPGDGAADADMTGDVIRAVADTDDETFGRHVEQLQEKISAGEIEQVVPSRCFSMPCPEPAALTAFRQLRETNASPYMFFLRGDSYILFGSSPESSVKYDPTTRRVEMSPIAGTRPRGFGADGGIDKDADARLEEELTHDAKELSEHEMLVDLARADLEPVCDAGSVTVTQPMHVERYSRVMHLVSRVQGTLTAGRDGLDAYHACMNMGTLTGSPKLRATELIREGEGKRRGSFGGAVGYLRAGGVMDTCITIRSAFLRDGRAHVQAGAGVVRDSTPQGEADETAHKASAVLRAIAAAQGAELEVDR